MAELVTRGTFQKAAGTTGPQSITGVGFQPKALILYGVNRPVLDTYDDRSVWCYGFTDGVTSVALSAWSEDAAGAGSQRRWYKENFVYIIRYVGAGFTTEGALSSFDADGFTLNWSQADEANPITVHYLAIGGDVDAHVGKFQTGTVDNTDVVETGVGFQPGLLITAAVWSTATANEDITGRNNLPAIGFTDGVRQALCALMSGQGDDPTLTARYQRTSKCFGILSSTSAAVAMEGEIVSFDSDGFTVKVTDAFTSALSVYYLALGGVTAHVGSFTAPTSVGTQQVTGLGFQPGCLVAMSVGAAASAGVQTESRFSLGACDGLSQGGSWTGDLHNVATTVNSRITTASAILHFAEPAAVAASTAELARAEFVQFLEDGFELEWTSADAIARQIVYLAFLGSPTGALIETLPASNVRGTQATLRGRINPNGTPITGWFAWGLDPDALATDTLEQSIGSGAAYVLYTQLLENLTPDTTYYFRAVGGDGGSPSLFGAILSFTTSAEQEFIDGEVSFPLTFLELTKRDGLVKAFAEVDLNDPPWYYSGYKAPWVDRFTTISRGLSDRNGQIEHLAFGALFNIGGGRYFRALLEDAVNRFLTNRPTAEWFIDDEDRRIQGPPRLAALGFVNDYAPRQDFGFELKCSDWLKKKFSRKRKDQQSWQPLIPVEDFPNCPEQTIGQPAPLIYGEVSDRTQATVEVPEGSPAVPPSAGLIKPQNLTATVVGGAGTSTHQYGVTALDARYGRHERTRLNHEGETDASVITVTNAPSRTQMQASGGSRYVALDWSDVVNALLYRIYGRDENAAPHELNLLDSANAALAGGEERYNDGERNGDAEVDTEKTDSHPPATNQTIVSGDPEAPGTDIVVDTGAGQVPVIYTGLRDVDGVDKHEWLVCRLACKAILGWYLDGVRQDDATAGSSGPWIIPGFQRWTDEFGAPLYRDFNGRRYTVIYRDTDTIGNQIAEGEVLLTLNVQGVEDVGDGTGTLLRSLIDQRLHFMSNFIAPDTPYQSGAYLTAGDTVFPHQPLIPLVDEVSHTIAKAALAARLGGTDYEGGGIIGANGEFISALDVLAQFQVSADVDQVFNRKGQDTISVEPIEPAAEGELDVISDITSIREGSFAIADHVHTDFFNILPYVHTRDYAGRTRTGWYGAGEERSQTSIDNHDQERESRLWELHFCRADTAAGAATLADSMARKKARLAEPLRTATMIVPFSGLNYEPGSRALIDAVEGIGAAGWIGREVRFRHHDVEPTDGYVRLDVYDLAKVFENQGSP